MSFKKNLKKKIETDRLVRRVLGSLEPGESGVHADKEAMRALLERSGYTSRTQRDLELFSRDFTAQPPEIVVLDNELPLYRTSPEDVVLRRSPYLKEMISIRNAIRILSDKDVVVARRADTVMHVRQQCIMQLDLRYNRTDIESICEDGTNALNSGETAAAAEALTLFAELLDLQRASTAAGPAEVLVFGGRTEDAHGNPAFGRPLVIYNQGAGELGLAENSIPGPGPPKPAVLRKYLSGQIRYAAEGGEVFEHLMDLVLQAPDFRGFPDSADPAAGPSAERSAGGQHRPPHHSVRKD